MQSLVNRLLGQVRLEIEGAYPERFLNICAANGLPFWGLVYQSETCLHVSMTRKSYQKLEPFVQRAMCTATPLQQTGLPFFLGRFRHRYAFLVSACLCILSLFFLSQFIIDVEITGNETTSTDRILTVLKEYGLHPGAYGPSIDVRLLSHQALLELPELSYLSVNVSGCRATVVVRDRIPKPEIVDFSIPTNVVAAKAGIITRMETLEGVPKAAVGSTVLPGELLISGIDDLESADGDGSSMGTRVLHAMGNVYAKTYYHRSATIPLTTGVKSHTGARKRHLSLLFGGWRINFYGNGRISYDNYDKIETVHRLRLPFGLTLPVGLQSELYTEYALEEAAVNQESAEALLQAALLREVEQEINDGTILHHSFTSDTADGILTVTLLCECEEQIGITAVLPTEQTKPEPAPESNQDSNAN